jgi:hypothetical protein
MLTTRISLCFTRRSTGYNTHRMHGEAALPFRATIIFLLLEGLILHMNENGARLNGSATASHRQGKRQHAWKRRRPRPG